MPTPKLQLDGVELRRVMAEVYKISSDEIDNLIILIDAKPHLYYRGSQVPKLLDRIFRGKRDYNKGPGSIIRLSMYYQGKRRTIDNMNHTLAHELEHVAQQDRRDPRILIGTVMIWITATFGAWLGLLLGTNTMLRMCFFFVGMAMGHYIGYSFAPHEIQARKRSKELDIHIVKNIE
jgi:hypothetical protein